MSHAHAVMIPLGGRVVGERGSGGVGGETPKDALRTLIYEQIRKTVKNAENSDLLRFAYLSMIHPKRENLKLQTFKPQNENRDVFA